MPWSTSCVQSAQHDMKLTYMEEKHPIRTSGTAGTFMCDRFLGRLSSTLILTGCKLLGHPMTSSTLIIDPLLHIVDVSVPGDSDRSLLLEAVSTQPRSGKYADLCEFPSMCPPTDENITTQSGLETRKMKIDGSTARPAI